MSGHSKWHTIKHKKGAADAKRGRVFTRIIKELTVAARGGGGDVSTNPRLRTIIAEAKAENMPADNIKRAIQRGTGELPGLVYEEAMFEGYGPSGVAVMVETASDNRNRTVSELRHVFTKNGGNLGENGCVSWMFARKGCILVAKDKTTEDQLMNIVLEAGGDDLQDGGEGWTVYTAPEAFNAVAEAIRAAGIEPASAELTMVAQNTVKLDAKGLVPVMRMIEALEDHEDVQKVHSNFDAEEKELQAVG